ncbi:MAG TPA: NAD-dependent epimerase/dehydratase family protein [Bacteroidales bacterium]|nr:NAD-dependent epimerase/dehydratase family protein [Bacteroidales bacterium]HOR82533.1 NAD-dependent epimerase/dehydratase family protein [Bacteroidales bacterium]
MQEHSKIRVGITGQIGFVGSHLYNTLGLYPERYERIPFEDAFYDDFDALCRFVKQCDVVVHLAAMNRHPDPQVIYDTNLRLVKQLIEAMEAMDVRPYLLFSSSIQEEKDNLYGSSKREGRKLLHAWAERKQAAFSGLIIPNVYGPFGRPNYNSFVATFCYKLTHNEQAQILTDSEVPLIYVGSLVKIILDKIDKYAENKLFKTENVLLPHDMQVKVSDILSLLEKFKTTYIDKGYIPALNNDNEKNLFYTFHSFIEHAWFYPKVLEKFADERGFFVETVRFGTSGQTSFSLTLPGVTRGNHFHTRKIERFTVIKGKARIQLRRIGTKEVISFDLEGSRPAYVDMPIWYTHNITNIGKDELYTQFWINEWYNKEDGDTYFEKI